jgi:hypothetical protein
MALARCVGATKREARFGCSKKAVGTFIIASEHDITARTKTKNQMVLLKIPQAIAAWLQFV